MSTTINLTISLDHKLASHLSRNSALNFIAEQPDRFAVMHLDGADVADPFDVSPLLAADFAGGVMTWFTAVSDALMFRAYEQATGHRTALLSDECLAGVPLTGAGGGYEDSLVLLSSRPFHDN